MPKIRFLPNDVEFEAEEGNSILDVALNNDILINHNCGGNCACSTCHVIIESGYKNLDSMTEDEEDMLDEAEGLTETSRLACQSIVKSDLIVRIPETVNILDDDDF